MPSDKSKNRNSYILISAIQSQRDIGSFGKNILTFCVKVPSLFSRTSEHFLHDQNLPYELITINIPFKYSHIELIFVFRLNLLHIRPQPFGTDFVELISKDTA